MEVKFIENDKTLVIIPKTADEIIKLKDFIGDLVSFEHFWGLVIKKKE